MRFVIAAVLLVFAGYANGQALKDPVALRIGAFYRYYILVHDNPNPRMTISKDTMRKYCSAGFLARMRLDKELDVDPVVHAQDYDKEWLKTLAVVRISDGTTKQYCVTWWYAYASKTDSLFVSLKKEAGDWKIFKTCRDGYCY